MADMSSVRILPGGTDSTHIGSVTSGGPFLGSGGPLLASKAMVCRDNQSPGRRALVSPACYMLYEGSAVAEEAACTVLSTDIAFIYFRHSGVSVM